MIHVSGLKVVWKMSGETRLFPRSTSIFYPVVPASTDQCFQWVSLLYTFNQLDKGNSILVWLASMFSPASVNMFVSKNCVIVMSLSESSLCQ